MSLNKVDWSGDFLITQEIKSAIQMRCLGKKIGQLLRAGDVACLWGELGTGKTTLTQGIARGLEITEPVTSPSFTLIKEYEGRLPLYHIDAYRLDEGAAPDLGLEEYLFGQGVTVIEWAGHIQAGLPSCYLQIHLCLPEIRTPARRLVTINQVGSGYEELLEELKRCRF